VTTNNLVLKILGCCTGADAVEELKTVLGSVVTPGFAGLDLKCFGSFSEHKLIYE
jgi:hypothetical protein